MLKKINGRIHVPRLCEEKLEIVLELPPLKPEEFVKVTYSNLIMLGFILMVAFREFPQLCEHDMRTEFGNPHIKGDTKLWFDPIIAQCNAVLVDTQPPPEPVPVVAQRTKNMFDDFDDLETESRSTEAERTRRFFLHELATETDDAIMKAREKHHMDADTPKTFTEMIKRIQDGKFQIKENRKKHLDSDVHFNAYSAADWIDWRDPGIQPDEAGYEKTRAVITQHQTDAGHQIRVAELTELPSLIKDFRATYH